MGPLQFHMNFRISLSISIKKEVRSVGFNVHLLNEVSADRMTIYSSGNFAPIWTFGVKFVRIWDCLILGQQDWEPKDAGESITSGANLSIINKLCFKSQICYWNTTWPPTSCWPSLHSHLQSVTRTGHPHHYHCAVGTENMLLTEPRKGWAPGGTWRTCSGTFLQDSLAWEAATSPVGLVANSYCLSAAVQRTLRCSRQRTRAVPRLR